MAVRGATEAVKDLIPASAYNAYSIFDNEGARPLIISFATVPEAVNMNFGDQLYAPIGDIMNGDMTVDEWADIIEGYMEEIDAAKKAADQEE